MSRRPVVLSVASARPFSVYTHMGVEMREGRKAYGIVGDVSHLISDTLHATPLLVTTNAREEEMVHMVQMADGILFAGGVSNVHPNRYGQEPSHDRQIFDPERDRIETAILRAAEKYNTPVLGICRGMQSINVYYGGTLNQDICGGPIDHNCSLVTHGKSTDEKYTHGLVVEPKSLLAKWLGKMAQDARVNSVHGQAAATLGRDIVIEARAPDGVIEAIRLKNNHHFVYGTQWHPDFNADLPASKAVLEAFAKEVAGFAKTRLLRNMRSILPF